MIPKARPPPVAIVSVPPFAPTHAASMFSTCEAMRTVFWVGQAKIVPE